MMNNWRLIPIRRKCTECNGSLKPVGRISESELEVQCLMCGRFYTLTRPKPEPIIPVYEPGKCRTCGLGDEVGVLIYGFHAGECIRKFREQ